MSSALPVTLDAVKKARKDGRLVGFECAKCKHRQITPMAVCTSCKHRTTRSVDLPVEGRVESYTIQVVAGEDFINDVPFAFVIVKLADGTKVTGWIPYIANSEDLPMGAKVKFTPSYKPGVMFEKV